MKRNFYPFFSFSKSLSVLFLAFVLMYAATANAQPYTVFAPGDVPANNNANDAQSIENGFKFGVTQLGTISDIRFYQASGSNGVHTVNLWTNGSVGVDGTNLSTATATVAAGVGWRQIDIPDVQLSPGNVYVVSVFSTDGFYTYTNGYFPVTPNQTVAPFIIIANNDDPSAVGNGVYIYSVTSAFPNIAGGGGTTNYWVDLVFAPTFPLPVTLADFRATTTSNNVLLNWKTESENNNKGFEIQRSNNGTDWYAVHFLNGAGESPAVRNYSYTDKGLAPGLYYYRLKQLDNDGKFKNSPVVTATISGKGRIVLFQNAPNPFRSTATIRFDLPTAQKVRLSILDILGREVKVLTNKQSEAGSHLIPVDATGLSRQLYYIRLQTESGTLTRNMLVE